MRNRGSIPSARIQKPGLFGPAEWMTKEDPCRGSVCFSLCGRGRWNETTHEAPGQGPVRALHRHRDGDGGGSRLRPGRRRTRRGGHVARHAGEPALGRDRSDPGRLHAGRLRTGRDGVLPGEARGPRRVDELRDLRPGLHRLLPGRVPARVRRLQLVAHRARRPSARSSSAPATGCSCGKAAGRSPT